VQPLHRRLDSAGDSLPDAGSRQTAQHAGNQVHLCPPGVGSSAYRAADLSRGLMHDRLKQEYLDVLN
jgi:hypothetical protein